MPNPNWIRRGRILQARRIRGVSFMVLAASATCAQWMPRAYGATDSWTASTGNWAVAGNWSSGVPVAGATADITDDDNTSRTITYNYTGAAITLTSLTVDNDGAAGINTLSMISTGTALTSDSEFLGDSNTSTLPGFGVMNQSVGTNTISSGSLALGEGAEDSGTYNLSGTATVISGSEIIGAGGTGIFSQNGGTNTITNSGEMQVGLNAHSIGSYFLTAGTIACDGSELIGNLGNGGFVQSDGTNNCSSLQLGSLPGSIGSYSLSGSGVMNCSSEIVGSDGDGTFTQSGGTNNTSGYGFIGGLVLGYSTGFSGSYILSSAGVLNSTSGDEIIGYGGSGTFTQTGGVNNVTGDLDVGNTLKGGQGMLDISAGTLSISGNLVVSNATLSSVSFTGGTISLSGLTLGGNPSAFSWSNGTLNFLNGVTVDSNFALGASLALTAGFTLSAEGPINDNGLITTTSGAGLSAPLLNIGGALNYSGGAVTSTVLNVEEGGSINFDGTFTNTTTMDVATGGSVQLNGANLSNNGVIQVQLGGLISGTGSLINGATGLITGSGSIDANITNNGTIQPVGGLMTFTGAVTNPGTISAPVGTEALMEDMPTNAGIISLNGGTVSTNGATLHNTVAGQILGYGILSTGGLTNDGTIAFAGQSSVYGTVTNKADGLIHLSGNTLNVFYGAVTSNGQFTVDAGASGSLYGAYTGSGSILDNGALYLNANSVAGPVSGTGFLTIGSTSSGPAIVQLNASSGLSTQDALSINTGSTLDITNNHFIINYGAAADPASTIYGLLKSGYNGGVWTGVGIDSSVAALPANNASYGVGFIDGKDGVPGATVTSGQILIAYALYGDVNLDGLVNATDFAIFGANFNSAVTGWDKGDFTYTGLINATDFALLGANFGKSASGTAISLPASDFAALDAFAAANGLSLPSVPEPACGAMVMLTVAGAVARRRRAQLFAAPAT